MYTVIFKWQFILLFYFITFINYLHLKYPNSYIEFLYMNK